MSDCSKHPETIEGFTNEKLAEALGDMRYDSLADLLWLLFRKLDKDADADLARERDHLANALYDASESVREASEAIERAWEISKPHMDIDE